MDTVDAFYVFCYRGARCRVRHKNATHSAAIVHTSTTPSKITSLEREKEKERHLTL
jgi:hypothetical protein